MDTSNILILTAFYVLGGFISALAYISSSNADRNLLRRFLLTITWLTAWLPMLAIRAGIGFTYYLRFRLPNEINELSRGGP